MQFSAKTKWIGIPGQSQQSRDDVMLPAPCLRRRFSLQNPKGVLLLKICGLGYYECFLNGKRLSDHVLAPRSSVYDKHVWFDVYDVTSYLHPGENVIAVILGNGFYNCGTADTWLFQFSSWRDYPKLLAELTDGNELLLSTDSSWKYGTGPIVFDAVRNGETYDARLENGWETPSFNDDAWENAGVSIPPGGILVEDKAPPCRILETIPMIHLGVTNGYDAGQNLAGHARITVNGPAGATVELIYGERSDSNGHSDRANQENFIHSGKYQTDTYILSGNGIEVWEPRFVYHGFRYVEVIADEKVKLLKIEARRVGSDLRKEGTLESGNPVFDRIQILTERSFLANYVGIPTDCPHREKNGWTGDVMLAADTGLMNYDTAESYMEWLSVLRDTQRPTGQCATIAPSSGWGYSMGGGIVWDSVIYELPYRLFAKSGNSAVLTENYDAIVRNLDFCCAMEDRGLVGFGLGDWCHSNDDHRPSVRFSASASYFSGLGIAADIAEKLGKKAEADTFRNRRETLRQAFLAEFDRGNGHFANDFMTELGTVLFFGIPDAETCRKTAALLVDQVRKNRHRTDFGILGAKYVPRALADYGYADDAFQMFVQQEYPGWGWWVLQGAQALWEHWDGTHSRTHIMFGDPSAWFYRYAGGFRYDFRDPGPNTIYVEPARLDSVPNCRITHRGFSAERKNGVFSLSAEKGCTAKLTLPDGTKKILSGTSGEWEL